MLLKISSTRDRPMSRCTWTGYELYEAETINWNYKRCLKSTTAQKSDGLWCPDSKLNSKTIYICASTLETATHNKHKSSYPLQDQCHRSEQWLKIGWRIPTEFLQAPMVCAIGLKNLFLDSISIQPRPSGVGIHWQSLLPDRDGKEWIADEVNRQQIAKGGSWFTVHLQPVTVWNGSWS